MFSAILSICFVLYVYFDFMFIVILYVCCDFMYLL